MKIVKAETTYASEHQLEKMDLTLKENALNTRQATSRGRWGNSNRFSSRQLRGRENPVTQRMMGQEIIQDRISIRRRDTQTYQSNYSASLFSRSRVRSIETGEVTEHSQKTMMEKMVGGVIDKRVVMTQIERGEDVSVQIGSTTGSSLSEAGVRISGAIRSQTALQMTIRQTDIKFEDESTAMSSRGEVVTEDGRIIDFSLDMSMNRTFLSREEESVLMERWQERIVLTDPLVISLDGSVPQLSDLRFEFDLDADGVMDEVNFAGKGSGFLAFDKNQDGTINDGSELFGPGTGNGFEELAAYDEDQNAWIDENDAIFSQLSVWTKDEDGNDRLTSLKDAGIGAINLEYAATVFDMTEADNTLSGQMQRTGAFLFEDGRAGTVHQIDLAKHTPRADGLDQTTETIAEGISTIAMPSQTASPTFNDPSLQVVQNQLKEILDRIDRIKDEMGRLYESLQPAGIRQPQGPGSQPQRIRLDLKPTHLVWEDAFGKGRRTNRLS